jgi:Na+/H+ antiporter NhaD and related arsenite permeases
MAHPRHGLDARRQPTILGSVANLIVVEAAREARVEIGFLEYCRVGVPLTIVTLIVGWLVLIVVPV